MSMQLKRIEQELLKELPELRKEHKIKVRCPRASCNCEYTISEEHLWMQEHINRRFQRGGCPNCKMNGGPLQGRALLLECLKIPMLWVAYKTPKIPKRTFGEDGVIILTVPMVCTYRIKNKRIKSTSNAIEDKVIKELD